MDNHSILSKILCVNEYIKNTYIENYDKYYHLISRFEMSSIMMLKIKYILRSRFLFFMLRIRFMDKYRIIKAKNRVHNRIRLLSNTDKIIVIPISSTAGTTINCCMMILNFSGINKPSLFLCISSSN